MEKLSSQPSPVGKATLSTNLLNVFTIPDPKFFEILGIRVAPYSYAVGMFDGHTKIIILFVDEKNSAKDYSKAVKEAEQEKITVLIVKFSKEENYPIHKKSNGEFIIDKRNKNYAKFASMLVEHIIAPEMLQIECNLVFDQSIGTIVN
uniref:Uncharacterized protein n=1 Tax=Romanomermis culicivorax TaxID=13658 RepID=A0A915HWS2_ROMCU